MQVEEGEVFGIVGGSGSGKSVLLRTHPRAADAATPAPCGFYGRDITQHERRGAAHASRPATA